MHLRGLSRAARALVVVLCHVLIAGLLPATAAASSHDSPAPAPERDEVVEQRTETSRTFRNPDGTHTTELFSAPIHYRGPGGGWRPISTRLVPAEREGYRWQNEANSFRASFSSQLTDDFLLLDVGPRAFTFSLDGAAPSEAVMAGDAEEGQPATNPAPTPAPSETPATQPTPEASQPAAEPTPEPTPEPSPSATDDEAAAETASGEPTPVATDPAGDSKRARYAEPSTVDESRGTSSVPTDPQPSPNQDEASSTDSRDRGALTYPGVFPGVDLRYELRPTGVKESLLLRDAAVPTKYRFLLGTPDGIDVHAEARPDGSWAFFASPFPDPVFVLEAPWASDAGHSRPQPGSRDGSRGPVELDVSKVDAGFALDLTIDAAWLADPARIFPVEVDPTVTIQPPIQDVDIEVSCSSCGVTNFSDLWIGRDRQTTWRAALQFDLGAIPDNVAISKADMKLWWDGSSCMGDVACVGNSHQLDAHLMQRGWSKTSLVSDMQYFDSAAAAAHTLPANSPARWMTWDLTQSVKDWRSGMKTNYGVLVKRNPETKGAGGPAVPSAEHPKKPIRPKLEVTWVSDGVQLTPPHTLHANGGELTWSSYAGQDAFQAYEVHRGKTSAFTPSASTLLASITDANITTYRDSTAAPSTAFTYKIVTNGHVSNGETVSLPANGLTTKTLQPAAGPGKSTTIAKFSDGSSACANYGAQDSIYVGTTNSSVWRSLVGFDLRDVPADAAVQSATLSLWHPDETTTNLVYVDAHRVTSAWSEGSGLATCSGDGATWYDAERAVRWTTEGGDMHPTAKASYGADNVEPPRAHKFNVATIVSSWLKAEAPNHGFLIKLRDESGTSPRIRYVADDYTVEESLRPQLKLTYDDGSVARGPSVAISSPAADSTVSGNSVRLAAAVSDDGRVENVEFLIDGVAVAQDTTAPYEATWDSAKVANGNHSITARATDDAGNTSTSAATNVTVANSAPPTVTVTSPESGATVTGTQTVTADASDDVGLSRVEFYADGVSLGEDAAAPYSVDWNTLDSTNPAYDGVHKLTAKAYDTHGQATESATVEVTVANTAGTKYQAGFSSSSVPLAMTFDPAATTQEPQPVDVTVTNKSAVAWTSSELELRYHWFTPTGSSLDTPTGGVALGSDLVPAGETRTKQLSVVPPSLPEGVDRSQYVLRFDLYDTTAAASFAARGNKPLENPVIVNKAIMSTALGLERYYHYTAQELGAGMAQLTNVASGNSLVRWTPFSAPGRGLSTVVDVTYNSLENRSDSPIGNNFSLAISSLTRLGLPLDVHPNKADDIAGRSNKWIEFTDADGTTHRFIGNAAADGSTYWEEPSGVHLYLREFSSTDATRKWALTRPDDVTFFYDADGYPTSVKDRNGNVLEFTLEAVPPGEDPGGFTKRVVKVTDAAGTGSAPAANRSFTIDYYSKAEAKKPQVRGKIESIRDHNGSTLRFEYYDDGNLLRLTQAGGTNADDSHLPDRAFVFTYTTSDGSAAAIADAASRRSPDPKTPNQSTRLFSVRDPRGNESTFTYYATTSAQDRWKLKTLTDRAGESTSFAYDITNRRTTVTQPLARASTYAYDTEGKITSITDPLTRVTTVRWNGQRQVEKVTEPGDSFSEYSYNDNGYLTEQRVLIHNGADGQAGTSDDVIATTQLTYENRSVDAGDTSGRWKTGRTIPHLSLLRTKTDPKGVATASPSDDFQWLFDHDQAGNLVKVTDPENFPTSYGYNPDGTLATITDARQKTTTLGSYDANGFPREMRDPLGNVTEFGYDDDGLLRWVQSPSNSPQATTRHNATHFDYDSFHRLGVQSTPKDDNVVIWTAATFDENDNVVASFAPESGNALTKGQKTSMSYDVMDRQTLVTSPDTSADPAGERTSYTYDAAGRVTRVTRPKGVLSSAVADDHTTLLSYDAVDRVVKRSRPEVDAAGGLVRTLNTHFCYNTAGDLTRVTAPKAGLDSVDCGSAAPDFTTQYVYDAAHRLRRQTDPEGNETSVTYDLNGNRETATDAKLNTITFSYDERNLRTKIVQPFKATRDITTRFEYDEVGNLKRLVSPRAWDAAAGGPTFSEFITDYEYDGANRLSRIALPAAANETRHFVHRAYDADGNLKMVSLPVAIADPSTTLLPNEHKTTLTHFDTGQVHTSNDGVNPVVRYDYTPEGWQLTRTPEKQDGTPLLAQQMRWAYFDDGMLSSVTERDGNPTTFSYDVNNNLKTASDASGVTTADQDRVDLEATYDSLDQVTKVRHRNPNVTNWTFTSYAYDLNGNVSARVDDGKEATDGTLVSDGRRHEFSYNRTDWLTSQLDHKASSTCQKVETAYDANGSEQLRRILRADASCGSNPSFSLKQKTTWDYFLNDKLKRLETTNGQGAVVEAHDVDYTDAKGIYVNGHRVSDNAVLNGPGNTACNTSACRLSYTYDGRDRVTHEHRDGNLTATYDLDPQSNIIKEVKDGIENAMTYSGNRLDTQTKSDLATGQSVKQRYHYDPWGNVDCITLAAGTAADCNPADGVQPSSNLLADYDYDDLNRLETYRSFTTDGVTSTKDDSTRYTYDALDRLVKQDETHGAKRWTTTFSHIGLTTLVSKEEISGDSQSSGKTYDYDAHGLRLSMTDTPKDTTQSAETYTYGYDVHGSVSLLLKDTGEAKASYGYSAYGQLDDKMSAGDKAKQSDGDIEDPLNAYRYSAKRFDTGSQTIDMGARRFGPDFNRFLQVDQYMGALADLSLSTDPLTANRYSLAGGNPITFVEVDGHVVVANGGGTAKKSGGGGGGGGGGGYTDGWAAGGGGSSSSTFGSVNAAEGPVDHAAVKRAMYYGCETVCPSMHADIQRYELSRTFARSGLQMHCSENCPDARSSLLYKVVAGDIDNCGSGVAQGEVRGSCGMMVFGGVLRLLRNARGIFKTFRAAENAEDGSTAFRALPEGDALAIAEHAIERGHLTGIPGIESVDELARYADDMVANAPDEFVRELERGRTAYWDPEREVVLIRDPASSHQGTIFRPRDGYDYFLGID